MWKNKGESVALPSDLLFILFSKIIWVQCPFDPINNLECSNRGTCIQDLDSGDHGKCVCRLPVERGKIYTGPDCGGKLNQYFYSKSKSIFFFSVQKQKQPKYMKISSKTCQNLFQNFHWN